MQKFTSYLYEYRNGKRIQNIGFIKVETTGSLTTIQIYGKGFPATVGQPLEIFLFYLNEGQCVGESVGQMYATGNLGNHRVEVMNMKPEIRGLILKGDWQGKRTWYAAIWTDEVADVEHMVTVREVQAEKPKEVPQIETNENKNTLEDEENVQEKAVYKITRQDLVGLPRKEWKLANNHFLMHGCRNFHHLISFEKDGKYWLGVPGIYHPNECKAAEAFGFGQFMKPDEGEITLTSEECSEQGEFGYWCRTVTNIIKRQANLGD